MAEGKAVLPSTLRIPGKAAQESEVGPTREAQPLQLPNQPLQACPQCRSSRLYRDGHRFLSDGTTVQRWICRDCSLRFSNSSSLTKELKTSSIIHDDRRVCVASARGMKNLASAESKTAGTSQPKQSLDLKGKLVEYSFHMEKQGYCGETIRGNDGCLRALQARNANLLDPESVKEVLAREKAWSQNRRRNIINSYTCFLRFVGITWEKPRCNVTRKIPFIPTEQEIDELIAGCPTTVATFLQLLKETAMRSGEAHKLKWTDVDLQRRTITLNDPEKGSLPRIFDNLSSKLLSMLNALPRTSPKVFGISTLNSLKATYVRARRRLSFKLQNPRLLEIHFHSLRHWKATMEYHFTKDILHVMNFLGHKKVDNTLLYVQLDQKLFKDLPDDSFIIRAAHNQEEVVKLGEVGFEPFDIIEGVHLYRKRK